GIYQAQAGWPLFMVRLVLACAALAAVVVWLAPGVEQLFAWGWQQKAWQMTILVVAGIGVFVATLVASGMRMQHLRR
ncbi:MAG TPA: murein biosynthesis integral membrane protein MurJ, partial [Pseudomonas nitrititolerans]|nr:murein biosynthesis integral membrane protein MurJ [Stutzerimonas nitrititolerans]